MFVCLPYSSPLFPSLFPSLLFCFVGKLIEMGYSHLRFCAPRVYDYQNLAQVERTSLWDGLKVLKRDGGNMIGFFPFGALAFYHHGALWSFCPFDATGCFFPCIVPDFHSVYVSLVEFCPW